MSGRRRRCNLAERLTEHLRRRQDIYFTARSCNPPPVSHKSTRARQILVAVSWQKRIIAETGAGQHAFAKPHAVRAVRARCVGYMARSMSDRQQANGILMEMLGSKVIPVQSASLTLKDAN